jgi:hypothetical protein
MNAPRPGWSGLLLLALLAFACVPVVVQADGPLDDIMEDPFERIITERDLAAHRFEASRADVKELARKRIEVLQQAHLARMEEYAAGRGTLDAFLEVQQRLAAARQPLVRKANVNREALEDLWRSAWFAESLSRLRYEAGQVRAADYLHARYARLDAEVKLALSRPEKK